MAYHDLKNLATKIKDRHRTAMIAVDWAKHHSCLDVWLNKDIYIFEERQGVDWYAISHGDQEEQDVYKKREEAENKFLALLEQGSLR